jgi:multicomponent K+:H+ antiporter subunit E
MMKRFLSPLGMPLVLLILWLLLNDSLSIGNIVLGAVLAALLGLALAASKLRPVRAYPKHPLTILRLIWHVAVDITNSNIAVARLIWLGRRANATPGFLKIPLRIRDPHGLAALACIVTYTPGTVWSDYSETDDILTLHVLDLKDEAYWLRTIQQRYESPLMEIFE